MYLIMPMSAGFQCMCVAVLCGRGVNMSIDTEAVSCIPSLLSNIRIVTRFGFKQDRQRTYNVTLRRVRETLLPWKSNQYCIFLCVFAHAWVTACACVRLYVCVCFLGVWVHGRGRVRACARVVLLIQYATYRHIVIYGLCLHHIFRRCFICGTIFGGSCLTQNVYFEFLYNFYVKHFSY